MFNKYKDLWKDYFFDEYLRSTWYLEMINIDIFLGLSCTLSWVTLLNVDQEILLLCKDILKTISQDKCSYGFAHAYNDNVKCNIYSDLVKFNINLLQPVYIVLFNLK